MKYYTIEDMDRIPFGFFPVERERDEAYDKYIGKQGRWGYKGEMDV